MTPPPGRTHRQSPQVRRPGHGLGAVVVIVALVALAALSAAVVRLGQQGQTLSHQDLVSARAGAAARSGIEWGLYQALKGSWTTCSSASQTLDLNALDNSGLRVTVSCDSRSYNEGEISAGVPRVVRLFTIDAIACNSSSAVTPCPDASAAARSNYVERRRQAQLNN